MLVSQEGPDQLGMTGDGLDPTSTPEPVSHAAAQRAGIPVPGPRLDGFPATRRRIFA